jgi:hypothetical protein
MGVDHVHNVNIIEQLNPNFVCSAKDVPSQCVLTDDYQIDVLGPIDHGIRLETLTVFAQEYGQQQTRRLRPTCKRHEAQQHLAVAPRVRLKLQRLRKPQSPKQR